MSDITKILRKVKSGKLSLDEAASKLSVEVEVNLGFARVDVDRHRRRGMPEVIFGAGKTATQIVGIMTAMKERGQDVLATRVLPEQYEIIHKAHPESCYHETARIVTMECMKRRPARKGLVAVICAGTSDIPVAEEAAITCERLGGRVERLFDVGVAGLHRLVKHLPMIRSARAVVVVAGMEGALPSVVGGLIDRPIIAVPTSVGYGTSFNGLASLLTMLNTCVPGVTVVNIDNGFGAGVAAAMINQQSSK